MRITQLSGDSTVTNVKYERGIASFIFEDGESDIKYKVSVGTSRFISEISEEIGSVHIQLTKLIDVLPVDPKSKIYVMPSDFGKQMKINRKYYNLALGLNSNEYPFMFIVQGSNRILVCPVRAESEIKAIEV